jgi:predicted nucleic acid-binding protein
MRVVEGTNILVSAVIKPTGAVGPVLIALRNGRYTVLCAQPLLTELVNVINRPRIRNRYA